MPMLPSTGRSPRFLALLASLALLGGACAKSSAGPPPVPATFTLHYHRALSDYGGWAVQAYCVQLNRPAPALGTICSRNGEIASRAVCVR